MVASAKKYDIIQPQTGKLDRRIFVDQDIYDDEMEKTGIGSGDFRCLNTR